MTLEQNLLADQVGQAVATLEGQQSLSPEERSQQTILAALAVLMQSGHAEVLGWSGKVAFMLTEMQDEEVTIGDLETLLTGGARTPEGQETGALAGGPPPVPPEDLGPIGVPEGFQAPLTVGGQAVFGGEREGNDTLFGFEQYIYRA